MKRFRVSFWDDRKDEEVFGLTFEAEDESDAENYFMEVIKNDLQYPDYEDEYPILVNELEPGDEYYDDVYDDWEDIDDDGIEYDGDYNFDTVFVIVQGGMVTGAYTNDPRIDKVKVIDLDTQDDRTYKKAKKRAETVIKEFNEVDCYTN